MKSASRVSIHHVIRARQPSGINITEVCRPIDIGTWECDARRIGVIYIITTVRFMGGISLRRQKETFAASDAVGPAVGMEFVGPDAEELVSR